MPRRSGPGTLVIWASWLARPTRPPDDALPYIINISVKGVPSQVMLNALSAEGIYVSAGSACSKGHRSDVLSAMGVAPSLIDSAIRISLSKSTTENDMDLLYNGIVNTVKRVRR